MKRFLSPTVFAILLCFQVTGACSLSGRPSTAQIEAAIRQTEQAQTLEALAVTRDAFVLQASAAAVQTQASGQTQAAQAALQAAAETAVAKALPSATATPLPTATPVPTATNAPPPPPPAPRPPQPPYPANGLGQVKIFLIAIGDNGSSGKAIGCGDSVIPVTINITPTQAVLRASLNSLLAIKDSTYGESGLYNSLYTSNLSIESLAIQNRVAVMRFRGTLNLGGECDSPRVKAQLEETALQFSTVSSVVIYINDQPLDIVLSEKG